MYQLCSRELNGIQFEQFFYVGILWYPIWGFPKIRGTFLGIPIIRTIDDYSILGSFWETTI